jgi:nucleoside-diphosphate-sugar epimerase
MKNIEGYNLLEAKSLNIKQSIGDAFTAINGELGMILTIISDGKLCGVVSSGNLRKAILNGFSINDTLDNVLNKDPLVVQLEELNSKDFTSLINKLEKLVGTGLPLNVYKIPVIDEGKKVLGLITTEMLLQNNIMKKFVIDVNNKSANHILVIGGAGYIGSILTDMLLDLGWNVRVLDNLLYNQDSLSKFADNERFSFIQGDVCDINVQVESINDIDCVVFLAEIVGDPACQYVPQTALKTNYLAVNSFAALCAHTNINRFVYMSSCSVYGASTDPEALLNEQSELNPVSIYARMKINSERVLFNQLNPMFTPTILRLATVFGHSYRPRFDLVVNTFAKNAYLNKSITVNGGDQWRPNVHVKDVAQAIIRVIDSPINLVGKKVFNVGGESENHTIKSIAEFTKQVFPECELTFNRAEIDLRNYKVDFSLINKSIGFKPKYSVSDGLSEIKNIFLEHSIPDIESIKHNNIRSIKEMGIQHYEY